MLFIAITTKKKHVFYFANHTAIYFCIISSYDANETDNVILVPHSASLSGKWAHFNMEFVAK